MKKLTWMASVLCVAVLQGCATVPHDAPAYIAAPLPPPAFATVYFYRVGAAPRFRVPDVIVGQNKILEPSERTYTWFHLKEGTHRVRVDWAWDTHQPDLDFPLTVVAGGIYYLKLSGSSTRVASGPLRTSTYLVTRAALMDRDVAEDQLQNCCKYLKPALQSIE